MLFYLKMSDCRFENLNPESALRSSPCLKWLDGEQLIVPWSFCRRTYDFSPLSPFVRQFVKQCLQFSEICIQLLRGKSMECPSLFLIFQNSIQKNDASASILQEC